MFKLPKEVKVGILAVIALALFLIGISWLRGQSVLERTTLIHAYYTDIKGLTVGSAVLYKGMKVGQVRNIELAQEKERIKVVFDISSELELPRDSKAMIVSLDVLGSVGIRLLPGQRTQMIADGETLADSLEVGLMERITDELAPKITSVVSRIDSVVATIQGTMKGANNRANRIIKSIEQTSNNLTTGSRQLMATLRKIDQTIADIQLVVDSIQSSGDLNATFANARAFTDSLREMSTEIKRVMQQADRSMANIEAITAKIDSGEGTLGLLLNDPSLNDSLTAAAAQLQALLKDLQENPKRYVHFSVFGRGNKARKNDDE
mgnify:CR=1 FL=1